MNNVRVSLTRISHNSKTGPIAVSSTSAVTCPDACPLKKNGCYADMSFAGIHWRKLDNPDYGYSWDEYCKAVKALPKGHKLRHNIAGDLLHENGVINAVALVQLVAASKHIDAFTYTHHAVNPHNAELIKSANNNGFTINLSANNLHQADEYKRLNIGPVVVLMPEQCDKVTTTPAGNTVIQCPATYMDDIDCSKCLICANATRKAIIGFPAHGAAKRKVIAIAKG